jgi:hypothetical protein
VRGTIESCYRDSSRKTVGVFRFVVHTLVCPARCLLKSESLCRISMYDRSASLNESVAGWNTKMDKVVVSVACMVALV